MSKVVFDIMDKKYEYIDFNSNMSYLYLQVMHRLSSKANVSAV